MFWKKNQMVIVPGPWLSLSRQFSSVGWQFWHLLSAARIKPSKDSTNCSPLWSHFLSPYPSVYSEGMKYTIHPPSSKHSYRTFPFSRLLPVICMFFLCPQLVCPAILYLDIYLLLFVIYCYDYIAILIHYYIYLFTHGIVSSGTLNIFLYFILFHESLVTFLVMYKCSVCWSS